MIAAWITYGIIIGALVSLAAGVADAIQRRRGGRQRWIWVAALTMTVALMALAPARIPSNSLTPRVALPAAYKTASSVVPDVPAPSAVTSSLTAIRSGLTTAVTIGARLSTPRLERWMKIALPALSGVALLICAATYLTFAMIRRRLPHGEVLDIPVRIAARIGPAVVGLRNPEIIVPRWLIARTQNEQRVVLSHETEHIRAGDPLLLAFATATIVAMPWNPFAWWMASRLRLALEMDCDRRVLAGGISPTGYGTILVDLAEHCAGLSYGLVGLADQRSHLESRLRTMTNPRSRISATYLIGATGLALTAILAACAAELPTDVTSIDAASAEKAARSTGLIADSVRYVVNGVATSSVRAKELLAGEIGSIRVVRDKERRSGEIQITTDQKMRVPFKTSDSLRGVEERGQVLMKHANVGYEYPVDSMPLYLLNGVAVERSALGNLDKLDVLSVEVLKGAAALNASADPRAKFGVMKIRTAGH